MKRLFVQGIVCICLLVVAIPAWSLALTDVGSIDELVSSARLSNSGDATELQWVRNILGDQTLGVVEYGTTNWTQIASSSVYALELSDPSSYFFIKVGTGGLPSDAPDHFLFKNLEDLNYAVIDIGTNGIDLKNIGKISHFTAVPEPSTLVLLGGGLLGLAVYGRRRIKK